MNNVHPLQTVMEKLHFVCISYSVNGHPCLGVIINNPNNIITIVMNHLIDVAGNADRSNFPRYLYDVAAEFKGI